MAEIKTKVTDEDPKAFLERVEDPRRREDGLKLLEIFEGVTGLPAKLWGKSMIGFGSYHYESAKSAQKGDWPLTAFSAGKQQLTVYLMTGFTEYGDLLEKLGKHATSSGSCLYIRKLTDVDEKVLARLIKRSVKDMRKKYSHDGK